MTDVVVAAALVGVGFGLVAVVAAVAGRRATVLAPGPVAAGLLLPCAAGVAAAPGATAIPVWDAVLTLLFVATAGCLAAVVSRWVLLVAAGLTLAAAVAGPGAVEVAALGAGAAAVAASSARPLPAVKALSGGATAVALCHLAWPASPALQLLVAVAVVGLVGAGAVARHGFPPRWAMVTATALVLVGVAPAAAYAAEVLATRSTVDDALLAARRGMEAARNEDLVAAKDHLETAARGFHSAAQRLDPWYAGMLRLIPGVAPNVEALQTVTASGTSLSLAASDVATAEASEGLRMRGGRLDLDHVQSLASSTGRLVGALETFEGELEDLRSSWLVDDVRRAVADVQEEVGEALQSASVVHRSLRTADAMLGGAGHRRYLLAMQTNSEARATGGIIGSVGLLEVADGKLDLTLVRHGDELNEMGDLSARRLIAPPDYVERYARYEPERTWQNVNLSPHVPTSSAVALASFAQATGIEVDGLVLVDPFALAGLLRLTGPIEVAGWDEPLHADNVAAALLYEQYVRFPRAERIDVLGDTVEATFDALTTADLPSARRVVDALAPLVRGRHLAVHSVRGGEQYALAALGLSGAVPPLRGDYASLITQNATGNKIDWFLRRAVTYDATWDPATRTVSATANVVLNNTAPASGLPDILLAPSGLGTTRRGWNRTIVSWYSPLELESAELDGEPLEMERQRELGRYVYSAFVDIRPGAARHLRLTLRGALPWPSYGLTVGSQPTAHPDAVTVRFRDGAATHETSWVADGDRHVVPPEGDR